MGGHGGLNILPQKRWNVYNFDNREKVRLDEEAAAKEEQLKREQDRKRDTESRIEKLRLARGLRSGGSSQADDQPPSTSTPAEPVAEPSSELKLESESDSKHMNLFEGIRIFDPIRVGDEKRNDKKSKFARDTDRNKKVKKEEVRVVGPEDEKYRLGYGVAGKGVKLPWYMEKRVAGEKNIDEDDDDEEYDDMKLKEKRKRGGKKTLEELREERLKRERTEKEREKALLMMKSKKDRGFSSWRR